MDKEDPYDFTKMKYNQFLSDLEDDERSRMKWISDELQIHFMDIIDEYSNEIKNQSIQTAIRLKPYFEKALKDADPNVRNLAKQGLEFLKENFKDFI